MKFLILPASLQVSKLLLLVSLLVCLILPDVSHGWSFGLRSYPNSNGLFRPWQGWTPTPATQIKKKRQASALLDRFTITKRSNNNKISSPPFEITDTENEFQVSLDVPGVKRSDIQVDLLHDGATLSISGLRKHKKNGGEVSTFKFSKHFSLDPAVNVDKLKASLQNGVLIVSAPKVTKRIGKIPVRVTTGDEVVSSSKPNEDDEANTTLGGEASFDARHGADYYYRQQQHDPMEEEENDTNAA